jgi:type II secretory pathway component PulM
MEENGKRLLRIALGGGVIIICILILQFILRPAFQRDKVLNRLLPDREKKLSEMRIMAAQYKTLKEEEDRISRLLKAKGNKPFLSELEGFATLANVKDKISSIKPTTSSFSEKYQEESIEIEFKDINLEQLLRMLYQIEGSERPMTIKAIRIKSISQTQGLINATLKVTTIRER